MNHYPMTIEIYAQGEEAVSELRQELALFIESRRLKGIAVTAERLTEALRSIDASPFLSNSADNYLSR